LAKVIGTKQCPNEPVPPVISKEEFFSMSGLLFLGGFKFEAQRALKIDGTPLKVI
jgi:hypothetical protein